MTIIIIIIIIVIIIIIIIIVVIIIVIMMIVVISMMSLCLFQQSDADDTETDGCLDTMTESESQLSYVRQVGAIRKAGSVPSGLSQTRLYTI